MQHAKQPSDDSADHSRQAIFGMALVLVSSVAFSSKAIMVKLAYAYPVDAATLIAVRMLFSMPFFIGLILWIRFKRSMPKLSYGDIALFLFIGVVTGYGSMWLNFEGLRTVSAGLERVILFLYPTLVVLLNALLNKHKIGKHETIALATSYLGVLLVVWHDISMAGHGSGSIVWGALLVFASAVTYALYLVLSHRLIKRFGALLFTAYGMVIISASSAVHFALTAKIAMITQLPVEVLGLCMLMALIATVVPSLCLNMGIQRLGSNTASLLSTIGPVSTIYLAWLILDESVTMLQMFGTLLVMLSVLSISLKRQR